MQSGQKTTCLRATRWLDQVTACVPLGFVSMRQLRLNRRVRPATMAAVNVQPARLSAYPAYCA
jgi:hypothetical protein